MPQHFLITGATGKTGRRVAGLLKDGGHPAREASRSSKIRFDWAVRSTWAPALDAITAAYVVMPDLGSPGAVEQARAFADLAAAHGVERAVLVSVPASGGMDMDTVTATEQAFVQAGLGLTVLRLRWFSQNFSEDFLHPDVASGDLRFPAGDGQEAFVDADDIAEVAVAALLDRRHTGQSYEVTGPRLLSFHDIAAELSAATGRAITYTPLSLEQFTAEQLSNGVPEGWAHMLGSLYAHIGTGALATTTHDVEKVLGKPARDFTAFAQASAAAGTWGGLAR